MFTKACPVHNKLTRRPSRQALHACHYKKTYGTILALKLLQLNPSKQH